jgi:hypothetical protein
MAQVLVALLPIPPKHAEKDMGKRQSVDEQTAYNRSVMKFVFHKIFRNLERTSNGIRIDCADGQARVCIPRICGWIADYMEACTLHSVVSGSCCMCEVPRNNLGTFEDRDRPPRDFAQYKDWLDEHHESDAVGSLGYEMLLSKDVHPREGVFWGIGMVSLDTIARPDLLHTVYLGIIDHLMKWIMDFLKTYKRLDAFNTHWRRMPAYPGFRRFQKEFGAVSQWTGIEMRTIPRVLIAVLSATLLGPAAHEKNAFDECILAARALVRFVLMLEYDSHDEETLAYTHGYLRDFHAHKDVFLASRARKKARKEATTHRSELRRELLTARQAQTNWTTLSRAQRDVITKSDDEWIDNEIQVQIESQADFDFIKIHMLNHFVGHIRQFGAPSGFSTEGTERLHHILKDGYRHSNHVSANAQILKSNARIESFQYENLNNNVQIDPSPTDHTQKVRKLRSAQQLPRMSDVAELAMLLEMDKELLISHLVMALDKWWLEDKFKEELDERDLLEGSSVTLYYTLEVPRKVFNSVDDQTVHFVRCTLDTKWSSTGEPRNDDVFLDLGEEGPGNLLTTNGLLPARLLCLFHLQDPSCDEEVYKCALVKTYKTSSIIRDPGAMATCFTTDSKPTLLQNLRYRISFAAGATFIVPIHCIVSAACLVPFRHNPSNNVWFINNNIDLWAFNTLPTDPL